jgi:hypothetical protein
LAAETCDVVTIGFDLSFVGSKPTGFQPGAGTRTLNTPSIMTRKHTMPIVRKSLATALPEAVGASTPASKKGSSWRDSGEATRAPPPKPMMAIPVARPGRSGNHLINVETGEM